MIIWRTSCPFCNQGTITPIILASGALAIICDECYTAWLHPDDIETDQYFYPSNPDWSIARAGHIKKNTFEAAAESDIERAGWGSYD